MTSSFVPDGCHELPLIVVAKFIASDIGKDADGRPASSFRVARHGADLVADLLLALVDVEKYGGILVLSIAENSLAWAQCTQTRAATPLQIMLTQGLVARR